MDLRATCLGDSQCPQYFSRFFCCFLEVKSRLTVFSAVLFCKFPGDAEHLRYEDSLFAGSGQREAMA